MVTEHDDGRTAQQRGVDATRRSAKKVIELVTEMVNPILQASGLFLDRVEYGDFGRSALLQVFVDKEGGVGIEECVDVSRQLSAALDIHDVIPRKYTLEVSSPGLTRPLKRPEDYERFTGRLAVLHLRKPVEGRREVVGRLRGREEDVVVVVEQKSGTEMRIPLGVVAKARLEVEM